MAEKRYYWLKLKRDFFKRHDIQIIEDMPNGKEYILFYLKLLCESVDHDGTLRFSEQIPYNENMLATITRTNVDIVRAAIQVFTGLNMMEIMDDGTYFMREVHKMLGSETEWAEKKRQYRLSLAAGQTEDIERTMSDKSKSKSIEKEIENIPPKSPKGGKGKPFSPPTREDVRAYAKERNSAVDPDEFFDFFDAGNWIDSKGNQVRSWKQKFITWEKFAKEGGGNNARSGNSGNAGQNNGKQWNIKSVPLTPE